MIREESLKKMNEDFAAMAKLLTEQFSLLEKQIDGPINLETTAKIKANEKQLDQYEIQFRESIVNDIVRLTPRARDLRRIIALLNIIIDMERMGDLLNSINKRLPIIANSDEVWKSYQHKIRSLFSMVQKMNENIIYAFETENDYIARNIIATDDQVDDYYHEIHRQLFQNDVKADIMPSYLNLSRVLYMLERIGDCCTNIAEDLVYLVEGINVKHTDL